MSESSGGSRSCIGITGLLGVAFIVLKLTGYIAWPWVWVLAPFWVGLAVWLVVTLILFAIIGVVAWVDEKNRGRR